MSFANPLATPPAPAAAKAFGGTHSGTRWAAGCLAGPRGPTPAAGHTTGCARLRDRRLGCIRRVDFFYWWNDPSFLFAAYHSSRVQYENFGHYANPQVDALISQGASTTDSGVRCVAYQQAMDIIMNDAGTIPLQFKRAVYGMSSKVKGINYTSVTYPMLYNASLG